MLSFPSGKGKPMFLTPRKGRAVPVCEKIILAHRAAVFFRQNLAVAKHGP